MLQLFGVLINLSMLTNDVIYIEWKREQLYILCSYTVLKQAWMASGAIKPLCCVPVILDL
jgi:hypothetical protein